MLRPYECNNLEKGAACCAPTETVTDDSIAYGALGSSMTFSLSPVSFTMRRYHASG